VRAARLAVIGLILWPVAAVLHATLAVGHYEHRIATVTHGDVDVLPAWMAYELLQELTPRGTAATVADSSWTLPSLLYDVATTDGGRWEGGVMDTRIVAYPLWTAEAVMAVAASFLGVSALRRVSRSRPPRAERL
jgi:hypothetical protein